MKECGDAFQYTATGFTAAQYSVGNVRTKKGERPDTLVGAPDGNSRRPGAFFRPFPVLGLVVTARPIEV